MDEMMSGPHDELSFEDMRPDEKMIIKALEQAAANGQGMLRIVDLMTVNGWDEVDEHDCPEGYCVTCSDGLKRGNSKVRNNLRRLMRHGWIHRPVDGTYALVTMAEVFDSPPLPEPVVEFVAPVVTLVIEPPLVQIRAKEPTWREASGRNPKPMSSSEAWGLRDRVHREDNPKHVDGIKRPDCTFYNACLDQAIAKSWPGFSCSQCTAYALPDRHQAEMDILGLRALDKASEMLHAFGKIMRVRGVKPGADAKRTIAVDDDEDEFAEAV